MKLKLINILIISLFTGSTYAKTNINLYDNPKIHPQEIKSLSLEFLNIPLNELTTLLLKESQLKSYVVSPQLLNNKENVSFRYHQKADGDFYVFLKEFYSFLNYSFIVKNNIIYIELKKEKKEINNEVQDDIDYITSIYKPKYRDANALIDQIRFLFPYAFVANRPVKNVSSNTNTDTGNISSANSLIERQSDYILYKAKDKEELTKIDNLLNLIDYKQNDIVLTMKIYEVNVSNNNQSALSLVFNIAENIGLTLGNPLYGANLLKLSTSGISLLFSKINTDNNFKLLANPSIRSISGKNSNFSLGSDVPTLGSTTYQNGTPVQNIEYKSSGLLMNLTPTYHEKIISLSIKTELSDFINTTTGVNSTPTLTKRQLSTNVNLEDGETILLGGMTQEKETFNKDKSIFNIFDSDTKLKSKTELLIFIEANVQKDLINK